MIKTKEPQIYDSQNQKSAIIFFRITAHYHDAFQGIRNVHFQTLIEVMPGMYQQVGTDFVAQFRESTYLTLFGSKTVQEMIDQQDQLLIENLAYLNTKVWTGAEIQGRQYRFWDLVATDFEIVPAV